MPDVAVTIDDSLLASERHYLYLFARVRLRDPDLAEDAVQETLVAALSNRAAFEGRSSPRTWLVAILRNKISDIMRNAGREVPLDTDPDDPEAGARQIEALFRDNGHWQPAAVPATWDQPEAAFERAEFWTVFEDCLRTMPARLAETFVLREVMGESIQDICKNLECTETNCSVMLFRARLRLRGCLEENWFGGSSEDAD
jgi:RNA polymerase sigma-70 factor (ECF subfamily)